MNEIDKMLWKALCGMSWPEPEPQPPLTMETIMESVRKLGPPPEPKTAFVHKDDLRSIEREFGVHLDPTQSPSGCVGGIPIYTNPSIESGKMILINSELLNQFQIRPREPEIFIKDEASSDCFAAENIAFRIRHSYDIYRPDNLRIISACSMVADYSEAEKKRQKIAWEIQRKRQLANLTRKLNKKRRRLTKLVVRDKEMFPCAFLFFRTGEYKFRPLKYVKGGWKARRKKR